MTHDTHPTDDAENRTESQNHHHAIDACEHAADALRNGDLAHARALLDETLAAVERAQHDESDRQTHRETAFDCYD